VVTKRRCIETIRITHGFGAGIKPNMCQRKILYPSSVAYRYVCRAESHLSIVGTSVKLFPFCHGEELSDWNPNPRVFHVHVMTHFGENDVFGAQIKPLQITIVLFPQQFQEFVF